MLMARQCYILTLIWEVSMNRKWMVTIPLFAILAWAAGTQQDAKTVIGSATKADVCFATTRGERGSNDPI